MKKFKLTLSVNYRGIDFTEVQYHSVSENVNSLELDILMIKSYIAESLLIARIQQQHPLHDYRDIVMDVRRLKNVKVEEL